MKGAYVWIAGLLAALVLAGCGKEVPAPTIPETTAAVTAAAVTDPEPTAKPETEPESTAPETLPQAVIIMPTKPNHTSLAVWDESDWQVGQPISPQPGDTASTWDPGKLEGFPSDDSCSDAELLEKWMAAEGLSFRDLDDRDCEQLVLAAARKDDGTKTTTLCYEKQPDGTWALAAGFSRMQGWAGSKGVFHDRRRDTLTSPAGLWSLGLAFGNEEKPEGLKLPWRDVTPNSDWVCDLDSPYYNTWQERGDPELDSDWSDDVEHLENYPSAYAYACVIRYNTAPYIIGNRGCAIFFHCSKKATEGCIGLYREDFLRVLLWLDPARNPYILITGYPI